MLTELLLIILLGILIASSLYHGSRTGPSTIGIEEEEMQEHVSTHEDSSGDSHTTRTVRITSPLEDVAVWTQRHVVAFNALKAAYP